MATMTKQSNSQRLAAVRVSVASAMKNHGEDVLRNTPKYYGMGIFAEAEFLTKVIDKLTGGDKRKLNLLKIEEEEDDVEVEVDEDADATLAAV